MFIVIKAGLILTASVVGGALVTFIWSDYLRSSLRDAGEPESKEPGEARFQWIPALTGIVERAIFTVAIAWGVEASGALCGGWVAAKAVSGIGPWNGNTPLHRARAGVGMLGSGMSLLIGVICGLALRNWMAAGR